MEENVQNFSHIVFHILELYEDSLIDDLTMQDSHVYINWLCGSILDVINPAREEDIKVLKQIKEILK